MTVQHCYVNDDIVETPTTTEAWSKEKKELLDDPAFISLYRASVLCNASIFDEGPIDPKKAGSPSNLTLPVLQRRCVQGNASDYAFIKCVEAIPAVAAKANTAPPVGREHTASNQIAVGGLV